MLSEQQTSETFESFVLEVEPRLWRALTAAFGPQLARDATLDALSWAWEHWTTVQHMDNPAGYLFRVGQTNARRAARTTRRTWGAPPASHEARFEPHLNTALAALPTRQRWVVGLVHGYGWTLAEVAEVTGLRKSTVQTHAERGMRTLRKHLGVQ